MSVRAILTNINDKSRHMFPCCTPKEQLPLMFNRQPTLTPCCPPESDQVIDGGGDTPQEITCSIGNTVQVMLTDSVGTPITDILSYAGSGSGDTLAATVAQGSNSYLTINFVAVPYYGYNVLALSAVNNPIGLPILPYNIPGGTNYYTSGALDTSTVGVFTAQVTITWDCGVIVVDVEYEVV